MIIWIPVTESLPPQGVPVLVKSSEKIIPVTQTDKSIVVARLDHEGYWYSNSQGYIYNVSHWAHLDPGSV